MMKIYSVNITCYPGPGVGALQYSLHPKISAFSLLKACGDNNWISGVGQ